MSRPKCPNHGVEMERTEERRIYICPISDAQFECDTEDQEGQIKYDKFGNEIAVWTISGDEE